MLSLKIMVFSGQRQNQPTWFSSFAASAIIHTHTQHITSHIYTSHLTHMQTHTSHITYIIHRGCLNVLDPTQIPKINLTKLINITILGRNLYFIWYRIFQPPTIKSIMAAFSETLCIM